MATAKVTVTVKVKVVRLPPRLTQSSQALSKLKASAAQQVRHSGREHHLRERSQGLSGSLVGCDLCVRRSPPSARRAISIRLCDD
mmetsp:Transcript_63063/g.124663  ORF Transcript_63063/g.124663 Transcript_63063/m.124663 type:complete len:85 (-) Transcript_63063:700-954(-)